MLTPAVVHALVKAGATAAMLAAAFEADYNERKKEWPPVAGIEPARPPSSSAGGDDFTGATPVPENGVIARASPLSKELSLSSLSIMTVDSGNSGDSPHSLPSGFQPDSKTKAHIIKQVGEAQAEAIVSSFGDYFASRPGERETAAGWQERLRRWAKREAQYQRGPPQLALMRSLNGGRQAFEGRRESG
jgi:hypothetical protein